MLSGRRPSQTAVVPRLGNATKVTAAIGVEDYPSWSRGSRGLYFVSDRGGTRDLWRYTLGRDDAPEGPPQQVTAGIEMVRAALCADGKRLAYTKRRTVCNAFRAPILTGRPATWADTTQLTFDDAEIESIDVSRDGRVIVSSDRSGNWDVWSLPATGGDLQQLTTDPALDAGPRWNPDGSEIAFYSSRTGRREVWIMPLGGGPARQITHGESESMYPTWSPNGLEIIKFGAGISVVPAQGGIERRVTSESRDGYPEWSPDGKWVVFTSDRDGAYRLWRVPASGGQAQRLTERIAFFHRWSLDGKQIYFIGGVAGTQGTSIWALSTDSCEPQRNSCVIGEPARIVEHQKEGNGADIREFLWRALQYYSAPQRDSYSYLSATIGSTLAARRAGR